MDLELLALPSFQTPNKHFKSKLEPEVSMMFLLIV